MNQNPLFFIALLPGEELRKEVNEFKFYCAERFGARHALKSPPHITLIPPFRFTPLRLSSLRSSLRSFAAGRRPFMLRLRDFGCFAPRVIFIEPESSPALMDLRAALARHLDREAGLKAGDTRPFHPHLTIAHRDLRREDFPVAWAHFSARKFQREWTVEEIALLRHSEGRWKLDDSFSFS